ncbi:Auxin responsive SAUR protein [Quillaja saponaria]|uniref:Auxin responsive SAUR protein n=1 Tax=Quillaja saponaria TaxID=32244 RepID=A0AAD7PEH1_QUISA|nr:Auxin responsive SAUR protein [Quillaja saponaria]
MDCLVLPVTLIRRRCTGSRLRYQPLTKDGFYESESPVTVVVGKEKRVFLVDPFVLEENPFRALIDMMKKDKGQENFRLKGKDRVIFVDVDAILFEHMLWLMHNDCSSLFKLNLKEIIDFYAMDN